jgi:hypothetical protein
LSGEVRDHEAIGTALKAAETGHLVLATLHSRASHWLWSVSSVSLRVHNAKSFFNWPTPCKESSRRNFCRPWIVRDESSRMTARRQRRGAQFGS